MKLRAVQSDPEIQVSSSCPPAGRGLPEKLQSRLTRLQAPEIALLAKPPPRSPSGPRACVATPASSIVGLAPYDSGRDHQLAPSEDRVSTHCPGQPGRPGSFLVRTRQVPLLLLHALAHDQRPVPVLNQGEPRRGACGPCLPRPASGCPRLCGPHTCRLVLDRSAGDIRGAGAVSGPPSHRRPAGVVCRLLLRRSPVPRAERHPGAPASSG